MTGETGETTDGTAGGRIARLSVHTAPEGVNSLWVWRRWARPWRVMRNFLVIYGFRYCPSLRVKRAVYRMIGLRAGERCSIGLGVVIDVFFPQLVSIGDNSILGYNTVVLAHEFLVEALRSGPVDIGRDVMIGANVTILPGVVIGHGATVSACSLVNSDVPAGAFVGGVPARRLDQSRSD